MRLVQRWMSVAVAVLALGSASPAWTQSCYFEEESPPILPGAPETQTTFHQALKALMPELAEREQSLTLPGGVGWPPGAAHARGFKSLRDGESKAGQGRSPISSFQSAVIQFQSALATDSENLETARGLLRAQSGIIGYNILMGNLDSVAKDLDVAEGGAVLALKNAPTDPGLLHLLGNLLAMKATRPGLSDMDRVKAFQAAKSYYDRAGAAGNVFSQYSLGMLYLAVGDLNAAQKELRAFQSKITDAPPGLARALDALDLAIKKQVFNK